MRHITVGLTILSWGAIAHAGVSLDLVRKDMDGNEQERTHISSQGGKLRMDTDGGPYGTRATMIFLGDRFLVIDHDEQSYIVMDEAMLNEVSAKMNDALAQMEAQLAQLPAEQREMAEQMMKSRMSAMSEMVSAPLTVESAGPGEWNGTPCTRYAVYEGSDKSQDICAAPLDQVEGADEMMQAFRGMAAYVQKLTESLPGPLASSLSSNPGAVMDQVKGFPIHSVDYRMGQATGESMLESVEEEALDESVFNAPEGYQRQDPFAGR